MSESPFTYTALSGPAEGMLTQEVITIMKRDSNIMRITVQRTFTPDGDYTDTTVSEVLYVL